MKNIIVFLLGCTLFATACSKDETPITDENKVIEIVNKERAKVGATSLKVHTALMAAAAIRAKELKTKYDHIRPDDTPFYTVIEIATNGSGENIAYGYTDAEKVMSAWTNSEGHKANILTENYTHIGVGMYNDGSTIYWVQIFAVINEEK